MLQKISGRKIISSHFIEIQAKKPPNIGRLFCLNTFFIGCVEMLFFANLKKVEGQN
jgi:hypothetical protein